MGVSLFERRRAAALVAGSQPRRKGGVDLAVVVNGFPRLSETFVLHELLELERQGLRLHVIALRRPEETVQQEALQRLRAEVEYLPELAYAAPKLALRAAHAAVLLGGPRVYLDGLAHAISSPDFSRANLRRSVILAHRLCRLGAPPVYVHFAHKPATIARFACLLTGIPYGLSAHAKDIWLTPERELARKVRDAAVVLTCTEEGRRHLERLSGGGIEVRLVHHGVDTDRDVRPGVETGEPPVVLAVGRLVEKKGHETLIRAAAAVHERGRAFRLRIAGEGVEWPRLQRLVHELRLEETVVFLGPLSESELEREYAGADVFALACRELENGDRDGIPNVLLEAMAHGLAIVSTAGAGVREAVTDGDSALLAERDGDGFATRLEQLIVDLALRERLGGRARERALERFDRAANLPGVLDALAAAGLTPSLGRRQMQKRGATLEAA